jgi:hypothetical protein
MSSIDEHCRVPTDDANGDARLDVVLSTVIREKTHQCRRADAFIR